MHLVHLMFGEEFVVTACTYTWKAPLLDCRDSLYYCKLLCNEPLYNKEKSAPHLWWICIGNNLCTNNCIQSPELLLLELYELFL